jgi:Flp pilus assembly protein TadG
MRLRTLIRAQEGATAVEFAIMAPVFLALVFGAIEFGRLLWTYQALQETAIAAARCMALPQTNCGTGTPPTYDAADTTAYIKEVAGQWGVPLANANITAQDNNADCGGTTGFSSVSLSYTFQSAVPYLILIPSSGIPLNASACFPNNP